MLDAMKTTTKLIAITAMVLGLTQTHVLAQSGTTTTDTNGTTTATGTTGNNGTGLRSFIASNATLGANNSGTTTITNGTNVIILPTGATGAAVNGQAFNTTAQVGSTVSISARIIAQNTNSTTNVNNGTVTTGPSTRTSLTTATLLRTLGVDANIAGLISGTNFAPGARLVFSNDTFFVVSGTDTIDVSAIMTLERGTNQIVSGSTDTNGLARPNRTIVEILRVTFNDTAINTTNGLIFYLQGIGNETSTSGAVNANTGQFNETRNFSLANGAGEGWQFIGSDNVRPIIVTGNVTARGTGLGTQ
jgi:hypothetical protein